MSRVDLSGQKVIVERDVKQALEQGSTELVLRADAVLTPAARDLVRQHGVTLNGSGAKGVPVPKRPLRTATGLAKDFYSPEAEAIKAEIVTINKFRLC